MELKEWFLKYVEDCDEENVEEFLVSKKDIYIMSDKDCIFPDDFFKLEHVKTFSGDGDIPFSQINLLSKMNNLTEINLYGFNYNSVKEINKDFFIMDNIDIIMPNCEDLNTLGLIIGKTVINIDVDTEQIQYTSKDKEVVFPCWKHEGSVIYFALGSIPKEKFSIYEGDLFNVDGFAPHGSAAYMFEAKGYGNGEYYMKYRGTTS